MIPEEALQIVLSRLEECGIPYMITGSFASNLHGVPRATQDADVVVQLDRESLDRFLTGIERHFYVSAAAAREALSQERLFNIVHLETGFKIDLITRKSRPFSQTEFSRRQRLIYLGKPRWFATPEDILLAKLEWSKKGGSERQYADALSVAKIRGTSLDRAYLLKWGKELGVENLLDKLLRELG